MRLRHLLTGLILLGTAASAIAELVVIANPRTGVAVMTRGEIANIFLGRTRQFFNGMEAIPVDVADGHPQRARFYKLLVNKELAEIEAYWSRQVFSGRQQPPRQLSSPSEVIKWVAATPGAIGFVDASLVDARVRVVYEFNP